MMETFFSVIGICVFLAAIAVIVDKKRKDSGKDGLFDKFRGYNKRK